MSKFHAISGMPRAGSTLLCNILNQNPKFYASSTSNLPNMVKRVSEVWVNNPETKNLLDKFPEETEERMLKTLRGIVDNWYHDKDGVVFDKSRAWLGQNLQLQKLCPDAKVIMCVRDLRDIFASVEKQNKKHALLSEMTENHSLRFENMFGEKGIIGSPLINVIDMIKTKPENIFVLKYKDLCRTPEQTMKMIYEFLGEPYFKHQFEDVKNTSTDCDGFYLNKFPHKGEGKVEVSNSKWQDHVSEDIADEIMKLGQYYNQKLGYE